MAYDSDTHSSRRRKADSEQNARDYRSHNWSTQQSRQDNSGKSKERQRGQTNSNTEQTFKLDNKKSDSWPRGRYASPIKTQSNRSNQSANASWPYSSRQKSGTRQTGLPRSQANDMRQPTSSQRHSHETWQASSPYNERQFNVSERTRRTDVGASSTSRSRAEQQHRPRETNNDYRSGQDWQPRATSYRRRTSNEQNSQSKQGNDSYKLLSGRTHQSTTSSSRRLRRNEDFPAQNTRNRRATGRQSENTGNYSYKHKRATRQPKPIMTEPKYSSPLSKSNKNRRSVISRIAIIAAILVIGFVGIQLARTAISTFAAHRAQEAASKDEGFKIEDLGGLNAVSVKNSTGAAPQVQDPALWDERGKAIMQNLAQSEEVNLAVTEGCPYLLAVNCAANTVTVYTDDGSKQYVRPYATFVCSTGDYTPLGDYSTIEQTGWLTLVGPSYGQYTSRIVSRYLFHSVPYYSPHQDDVEYTQFNELGTSASLGCIRLQVCDVKWIFDNCPLGTQVVLYNDEHEPGPMGKPGTIHIDPDDENKRGWDPTDPNPENPWDKTLRSGTAIRSAEAQLDWANAQLDGRWTSTINETDLQGHSTDADVEGTRG